MTQKMHNLFALLLSLTLRNGDTRFSVKIYKLPIYMPTYKKMISRFNFPPKAIERRSPKQKGQMHVQE